MNMKKIFKLKLSSNKIKDCLETLHFFDPRFEITGLFLRFSIEKNIILNKVILK